MTHTLLALTPIFSLIIFGYVLKHLNFPSRDFWNGADKLVYYILFPTLLIYKLSTAKVDIFEHINLLFSGIISLFILFILLIVFRKVIGGSGANFSSIIQGSIRFNTYVFLALVDAFFGSNGLVIAAVLISLAIPFINILCISSFAIFVSNSKASFIGVVKSILKNPLIIACFIGGVINYFDISLYSWSEDILKILSSAALPFGLLCVGVGLELKINFAEIKDILVSSFTKFLILPLIVYFIGKITNLEQLELEVLLLFSMMPTATSSYILAKELGGNSALMASIITIQTLLSIITIATLLQLF